MAIFNQFLLRLSFGLAVGMAITSPRYVISGFFRNHLYVTLGLTTLAFVIALSGEFVWWPALLAAVGSYVGAVCWLYEKARAGVFMLWLVAVFSLVGVFLAPPFAHIQFTLNESDFQASGARYAAIVEPLLAASSGLVLGITTTAMLLGHWYLNVPGMKLAPLQRLLLISAVTLSLHGTLSGIELAGQLREGSNQVSVSWWMLVVLRWVFGVLCTALFLWMASQTLQIPNTQSATGILYVAVIAVFTGELAALLLSHWPSLTL